MSFGAGLSQSADPRGAAVEATMAARGALGDVPPSLAVVFASPHFAERASDVVDAVHEGAGPDALVGCVAEAVVGGAREVEAEPAVSVWLAALPEPVVPFRMDWERTGERSGIVAGWPPGGEGHPHVILCDPFTFPVDPWLREVNRQMPGTVIVGGVASGAQASGETRLFLGNEVLSSGAVGVRLPAGIRVRTLVSQGCRPIGDAFTVTGAEANVILELGGRPPLERLREVVAAMSPEDRELVQRGLHVGRVIDEYKAEPGRGDYLVRGVVGADPESGAMAVGDAVAVGETVRFHIRDAASADADLRRLLDEAPGGPAGALLFTCNGRGSRLFAEPDHDAALASKELGEPPLAGLFCAGELGPVGGRNFLHGFTASMALLYEDA